MVNFISFYVCILRLFLLQNKEVTYYANNIEKHSTITSSTKVITNQDTPLHSLSNE